MNTIDPLLRSSLLLDFNLPWCIYISPTAFFKIATAPLKWLNRYGKGNETILVQIPPNNRQLLLDTVVVLRSLTRENER